MGARELETERFKELDIEELKDQKTRILGNWETIRGKEQEISSLWTLRYL